MVDHSPDAGESNSDEQKAAESRVADPMNLGRHDRLLWTIGRVAQAQVVLEMTLRELSASVTDTGPDRLLPSQGDSLSFAQVVTKLEAAIQAIPGLPDRLSAAAAAVLRQAREINRERNRVVHDHWVDVAGVIEYRGPVRGFGGWLRVDPSSGVRDITELFSGQTFVDDCLRGLWNARRAVVVLAHLLQHFRSVASGEPSGNIEELLQELDALTRFAPSHDGATL